MLARRDKCLPIKSPLKRNCSRGAIETILVAEDDPFVRSSVILRIESLGYSVIGAVNGNDALSKLRAHPEIDLLFTDIVMPGGMSGWELADRAREIRPDLPVVFSSGYALEMLAQQGRAAAKSVILIKPYRKAELAERLSEALTTKFHGFLRTDRLGQGEAGFTKFQRSIGAGLAPDGSPVR